MEYVEFKNLFKYFIKNIILMLFIFVVVVCLCFFCMKPKNNVKSEVKYESTNTILMMDIYDFNDDKENFVNIYTRIIKGSKLLNKVINNLELTYNSDTLKNMITIENINESEILKIKILNSNKEDSINILNEITKGFLNEMKKLYDFNNMEIIDSTSYPIYYNQNIYRDLLKFVFIGFVCSIIVVLIKYYFDSTIKTIDEIKDEEILGIIKNTNKLKRKDFAILFSEYLKEKVRDCKVITLVNLEKKSRLYKEMFEVLSKKDYKILFISNNKKIKSSENFDTIYSTDLNILENKKGWNEFKKKYDLIILGCNYTNCTDFINFLNISDGTILNIKMNKTKIELLSFVKNILIKNKNILLGVLIDDNN